MYVNNQEFTSGNKKSVLPRCYINSKEKLGMDRSNVEKYLLSVLPVKTMFDIGLLVKQEYNQAEHYLA